MARRRKIIWDTNHNSGMPFQNDLKCHAYQHDDTLKEHNNKFIPYLVKGALWQVAVPYLTLIVSNTEGYKTSIYPYAYKSPWPANKSSWECGACAIYFGTTRVVESKNDGRLISVLRHTFMIDSNIFMVHSLACLLPVI